jgi:16S rRNA (cytosine967-C5)-methyltransferase
VSFEVLRRVESGAYASDLLAHARGLDARDAGLATEIVFGCLRYQAQLDYMISRLTNNRTLDSEVQIVLRMGMYQMRYLERIPPHAAVSESVDLIKRGGKASAAPLVNAVLRKVNRNPVIWPDRATELSCPEWLLGKWERQFGKKTAEQMALAFLTPPENYVATTGRIQDIGSQSIVPLMDLRPGQSFLDLCAAPGNKTAQALQLGVEVVACDLHPHRLRGMDDLACHRIALDATQPLPFSRKFDRILVDAPCSGTGTLARNPEIKWRLRETDLKDLQRRQAGILKQALGALALGGLLVYSTCSLEREENEDVIAAFPGPWQTSRRTPGADPGDGFFAAVLPSV